jgi:HD-GYP domain-containing protein (c-di-GMP phosphodiesterase class II)
MGNYFDLNYFDLIGSILIGFILYVLTIWTYKYGIKNFQNKVIKEDYFITPIDFLFILISLFYYDKLFLLVLTFLGFNLGGVFYSYFIKGKVANFIFIFLNSITIFTPLFFLSFLISLFLDFNDALDITNNWVYIFKMLLVFMGYIIFNKTLTIFIKELFNFLRNRGYFIEFLSILIKRINDNFLGYLELILFSQAILAFIFFIFFLQKNYFNCFIILLIVFSIYYIDKILFDLYSVYDKTIEMVLKILEEYDFNTLEHSKRVAFIAKELAMHVGLSHEEVSSIELAAKLHDIGKLDVPSFILNKKSRLTNFEYKLITFHPIISAQISQGILSKEELAFIKYHHLYPNIENRKITYKDVPLGARIITIADIYDALRSKRSYKQTLSHEEVIKEMSKDLLKDVVDPYLFIKFTEIYDKIKDLYETKEN